MSKKSSLAKVLAGMGLGVGIGMLLSPKSGKENREDLKKNLDKMIKAVKEFDAVEAKDEILDKIEELKVKISELDKERVLEIAKEKGKEVKDMTNDLVCYAKDKGIPTLVKLADDTKNKTGEVVRDIIKKLEKNDD